METIHALRLGTTNAAKIHGVQAAFADLQTAIQAPDLSQPVRWTCQVDTGVSEEPLGFPSTVQGAQNRALAAYRHLCATAGLPPAGQVSLGIGVESGFIEVTPVAFTLYNFDVCAVFDGQAYYLAI